MSGSESEDYSQDGQSVDDLAYYSESEEGKEIQGESVATWSIINASEIAAVQVKLIILRALPQHTGS